MIFIDYEFADFETFCARNEALWRNRPLPGGARYLAVELLHNNATLLYQNLLIARYLAGLYNLRIVGVVADSFMEMPTSKVRVIRFARSFGVTDVCDIDAILQAPKGTAAALWNRLRRRLGFPPNRSLAAERGKLLADLSTRTDGSLRRAVLDAKMQGVSFGDLLYDSVLRLHDLSTIDQYDERLERVVRSAFDYAAKYLALLRNYDVAACMTSHTIYLEYGLLSRLTLKHGGLAFGANATLDAIRLRRFRLLEEAPRPVADLTPDLMAFFKERYGEPLRKLAERFYPPTQQSDSKLFYLKYGFGEDKQHLARDSMVEALGLPSSRKNVAVMAHMFSDAPHVYPNNLFDDYGVWLEQTLECARQVEDVNWLVRKHPYEALVGKTSEFDRITEKYRGCGNVFVVPPTLATSSLYDVADLTVTVSGTAGLEFAAAGIPCLLAGYSFYSSASFVTAPNTREAYFTALQQAGSFLRLTADQIAEAKEYAYVHFHQTFVTSSVIPASADVAGRTISLDDIADYWKVACQLVEPGALERDPLARFLAFMKKKDSPTLFNPLLVR